MKEMESRSVLIYDLETGERKEIDVFRGESAYEAAVRLGLTTLTEDEWVREYDYKRDAAIEAIDQKISQAQEILPEDLSEMEEKINRLFKEKVEKQQGKENAEKLMYVDDSGTVAPLMLGTGMQMDAVAGKNIVFGTWIPGKYSDTTGEWNGMASFNGNLAIQEYFPVESETTYTVSNTQASASGASMYVYEYTRNLVFIQRTSNVKAFSDMTPGSFKTSADTAYITISAYAYDGASTTLEASRPIGLMIEKGSLATEYEPYTAVRALSVKGYDEIANAGRHVQSCTWRGTLVAGESHDTGLGYAVGIGFKAGLYADFSGALDKITFQFDAKSPNQIVVDGANVTLKSRNMSDVVLSHGVSVSGNITVNIHADSPGKAKITVASNGVQNTVEGNLSITAYETFKIINGNTGLSNIVFTMGCSTINRRVWLFDDDCFAMTNPARWPCYANRDGYAKNAMFCGADDGDQVVSGLWLDSLMKMGLPKTLVWCMGMNYASDDSSAPAADWKRQIQEIMALCESRKIELILATIPTVPSRNHEQKNAHVRSSGCRYIDFAKAVGAQANGMWYAGMLSADGIHPTESGAIAMYNMALACVPELTCD